MLSKPLLVFIDDIANNVFQAGMVQNLAYSSFDEIIHMTMISLLREIIQNSCGK